MNITRTEAASVLYYLLDRFLWRDLDVEAFCSRFESAFNLGIDRKAISDNEERIFGELFNIVIWYSPFPYKEYPHYKDEGEIRSAAETARRALEEAP